MKLRTTWLYAGALVLVLFSIWLAWYTSRGGGADENRDEGGVARSPRSAQVQPPAQHRRGAPVRPSEVDAAILRNEREWNVLRVPLPEPQNIPWTGSTFTSENFMSPEFAEAAVTELPTRIRKAVLASDTKQAAGFLYSLLALLDMEDVKLKYGAALELYRLGSGDQKVTALLLRGLEEDGNRMTFSDLAATSQYLSLRRHILEHLRFYADDSLMAQGEAAQARAAAREPYGLAAVDFALYFEKLGRPQPDAFWLEVLKTPEGRKPALEVLRTRPPEGFDATLAAMFAMHNGSGTDAAAVAFSLGYGPAYEQHLIGRVEQFLASGDTDPFIEATLTGLLRGHSARGPEFVNEFLKKESPGFHEVAISALATARTPDAAAVMQHHGEDQINADLFPSAALKGLLQLNTGVGDDAYAGQKSALLRKGHVERDFDDLEYYRRHRLVL